jgi:hypothetical protein
MIGVAMADQDQIDIRSSQAEGAESTEDSVEKAVMAGVDEDSLAPAEEEAVAVVGSKLVP